MKKRDNIEDIFPEKGWERGKIMDTMHAMKLTDASWDSGRMFGFVYYPGEEASDLIKEICSTWLYENAISPSLFPSLLRFEKEVVTTVTALLNGGAGVRGNITSGGTESIFLALKSARDHFMRIRPGLKEPEIILPRSAHPAFRKAAHVLGLKIINLPLDKDYRADLSVLPDLITDTTIMLVASAPAYAHGVMDPITEMAAFADAHGILCHVDACLGGMFLPFMERCGYSVSPFDFRVHGVTSISTDLHKYGYGLKGASIILYRDNLLRRAQFFVHCDWPGGLFGTPTLLGSRSALPLVTAWALLKYFGMDGYLEMTKETMRAVDMLKTGISSIDGLYIVGKPVMSVFSFGSTRQDIYHIGDVLNGLNWHVDRIMEPPALHLLVTRPNVPTAPQFLDDLRKAAGGRKSFRMRMSSLGNHAIGKLVSYLPDIAFAHIGKSASKSVKSSSKSTHTAMFYGIAAHLQDGRGLEEIVTDYLDGIY